MDLASGLGRDYREIGLGGETFRVSPLTLDEWADMQAWFKAKYKSPLAQALEQLAEMDAAGTPIRVTDRATIIDQARKESRSWPPPVGSQDWFACFRMPGSDAQFCLVVLRKHQPDMTVERAEGIVGRITAEETGRLFAVALGGDPDDPKVWNSSGPSPA